MVPISFEIWNPEAKPFDIQTNGSNLTKLLKFGKNIQISNGWFLVGPTVTRPVQDPLAVNTSTSYYMYTHLPALVPFTTLVETQNQDQLNFGN